MPQMTRLADGAVLTVTPFERDVLLREALAVDIPQETPPTAPPTPTRTPARKAGRPRKAAE